MFVCRFGVEVTRYISVVSQRDIYVKERYVSGRVCSLSTDEISILSRGLTFCPTPRHINWPEVSVDMMKLR